MLWNNATSLLLLAASVLPTLARSQTPVLVHRQKYAMGTVFEIAAYDASPERASAALDEALQEAVRLDRVMSNYQSDSELSRLNRQGYARPQSVSPDLYRVIETALDYSRRSDGEFDITVGPLANYWKSILRGERTSSPADEAKLRTCIGYKNVVLIPPDKVKFLCPTVQIDLGAIGKGYAVDRIVQILRQHGISRALVNAGGSTLFGLGSPPNAPGWRVNLKPTAQRPAIILSDNSLSTSEQSAPSPMRTARAGHILDPATGEPLRTTFKVSVIAKTATDSDALSTALLLLGPQKGNRLIENSPGAGAVWTSSSGTTTIISNAPMPWLLPEQPQITHDQGPQP